MEGDQLSVLTVARDGQLSSDLKAMLAAGGICRVHETRDADRVFALVDENQIDLMLVADTPPAMDGVELVREIRTAAESAKPDVPVFLLIEMATVDRLRAALAVGVNEILLLPFGADRLLRRVNAYVEEA
ncbi:MAG: response regulator [Hyphomicrobiales bacterium]